MTRTRSDSNHRKKGKSIRFETKTLRRNSKDMLFLVFQPSLFKNNTSNEIFKEKWSNSKRRYKWFLMASLLQENYNVSWTGSDYRWWGDCRGYEANCKEGNKKENNQGGDTLQLVHLMHYRSSLWLMFISIINFIWTRSLGLISMVRTLWTYSWIGSTSLGVIFFAIKLKTLL